MRNLFILPYVAAATHSHARKTSIFLYPLRVHSNLPSSVGRHRTSLAMPNTCPSCGCSNPADFDDSSGNLVCTQCGTVVNDSQIVSEITFGENSAGAATVQGSFVGSNQTHAATGGRYRSGTSLESREQTIAEGTQRNPPALTIALFCSRTMADLNSGSSPKDKPARCCAELPRILCRDCSAMVHPCHHQQFHQGPQGAVCRRVLSLYRLSPGEILAHAD
jgi:hypothetical protein